MIIALVVLVTTPKSGGFMMFLSLSNPIQPEIIRPSYIYKKETKKSLLGRLIIVETVEKIVVLGFWMDALLDERVSSSSSSSSSSSVRFCCWFRRPLLFAFSSRYGRYILYAILLLFIRSLFVTCHGANPYTVEE